MPPRVSQTTFWPSGDQAGNTSEPWRITTPRAFLPSKSIANRSAVGPDEKMICPLLPGKAACAANGDQASTTRSANPNTAKCRARRIARRRSVANRCMSAPPEYLNCKTRIRLPEESSNLGTLRCSWIAGISSPTTDSVLLCVARDPGLRLRDIAAAVGVTERSTHSIVSDLVEAEYLTKHREGNRNHYEVRPRTLDASPAGGGSLDRGDPRRHCSRCGGRLRTRGGPRRTCCVA